MPEWNDSLLFVGGPHPWSLGPELARTAPSDLFLRRNSLISGVSPRSNAAVPVDVLPQYRFTPKYEVLRKLYLHVLSLLPAEHQ